MKTQVYVYKVDGGAQRKTRELFARVFREKCGVDVDYDKVLRNAHGKPQTVEDYYYNVSHSGDYWGIAIANTEIGFDLQCRREMPARLRRKILTDGEEEDLLVAWVLKEAYLKYLGIGLELGMSNISCAKIRQKYTVENWSTDDYVAYVVRGK